MDEKQHAIPMRRAVLAVGVAVALSGCGGGGGGGSSNVRPANEPPEIVRGMAVEGGEEVIVSVFDEDVRVSHDEFEGRIDGVYNLANGNREISNENMFDPEGGHGTVVAGRIAGKTRGVSADARLRLYRMDGRNARQGVERTVRDSARHGARVINSSIGDLRDNVIWWNDTNEKILPEMVRANGGRGMVGVQAGGNRGRAWQGPEEFEQKQARERTLLVGGGSATAHRKASSSNFPGADENVQSRWLTGRWSASTASNASDEGITTASGTSLATPEISGMLAVLFSKWPHLDAVEASNRLLETADRSGELYDQNDCGPQEDLNCGFYYLGQGYADLRAALEPTGDLEVAVAESVEAPGADVNRSVAQWSPAFGNRFQGSEALLADTVAFDDLGRDYTVDLSGRNSGGIAYGQRLFDRMQSRLARTGFDDPVERTLVPGVSLTATLDETGQPATSRVDADLGRTTLTAFGFQGGESSPMETWMADSGVSMLTDVQPALVEDLGFVSGVAADVDLTERVSLETRYWTGESERDAGGGLETDTLGLSDYGANRQDVAVRFEATEDLSVTVGQGRLREDQGVLGARGSGALDPGDGHTLDVTRVGLDYAVTDAIGFTARYERGQGRLDGAASGLIRDIEDLRTEQSSIGVNWQQGRHQAAFMVNRPLRVTDGTAVASVPVGRTVDGEVLREERRADIGTDGSQTDVELGYAYAPTEHSRVNVNLLYADQPDHDPSASGEFAATARYAVRF